MRIQNKEELIFNLFENCRLVNGKNRSLICDLQRQNYIFIPNQLYRILDAYKGQTKEFLYSSFNSTNHKILDEYFIILEENEFIFWSTKEESLLFPNIDFTWNWPGTISNAIVDIDILDNFDYLKIIQDVELLQCKYLQIRIFNSFSLTELINILKSFKESSFKSFEIIAPYRNDLDLELIENLLKENLRIKSIVFYSSPFFKILSNENNIIGILAFTKEKNVSQRSCGQIHWNYFNTNIKLFTEAQKHNTCLNRKISIDVNGEIKNCPSMAKSYGNIKDTTLAEAIERPGFKDMWYINKDQIAVCKDCEFRYICTDCRAYLENPGDIYSKPLKCGYNPYTAEWEEWSTNPLKQKAIEYYGMQELVKKEK